MAYDPQRLRVLSYTDGFTLWHYSTEDNKDDVIDGEYFDAALDLLKTGDMIMVVFWYDDYACGATTLFVMSNDEDGVRVVRC